MQIENGASPMTDTTLPITLTLSSGAERMFPTLTPAQIERIAAHGKLRAIRSGEVLIEAGARVMPFFVVTAGRVQGQTRKAAVPVDLPFAHVCTVRDGISNECVLSPTPRCWLVRWRRNEIFQRSLKAGQSARESIDESAADGFLPDIMQNFRQ